MRIAELLEPKRVIADLAGTTKSEVLRELAECLARDFPGVAADALHRALELRETLGPSTGLEHGVAIPHAKLLGLPRIVGCFARSREGVAFGAPSGERSHLFFVLAAPDSPAALPLHLKALARVARVLRNADVRAALLAATSGDELWNVLCHADDVS
ncbi:MAG: PTS sugar transporter subunit IIA [bacterium]